MARYSWGDCIFFLSIGLWFVDGSVLLRWKFAKCIVHLRYIPIGNGKLDQRQMPVLISNFHSEVTLS